MRVLAIDDEAAVQFFLTEALAHAGYNVTTAGSAEQAIDCLAAGQFDVAIVDLGLPGISGLELLPILQVRWPAVVPIVLSAHDSPRTAIRALAAGAYDFLPKPCTPAELRQAVSLALDAQCRGKHRWHMLQRLEQNANTSVLAVRRALLAESAPTTNDHQR